MWSFDDTLNPKLEFETPREVTCLSFCPFDENLLIGGLVNGQLIIWDLKDRLRNVETEEVLTPAQLKYRAAMRSFLSWTKQDNQDRIVRPVALSAMQTSQTAAITNINWMNRKNYVASTGGIKHKHNGSFRYFATASLDGTIAFWDMDFMDEDQAKKLIHKKKSKLPEHMLQAESEYEKLNRIFRPMFVIVYNRPITSMILDRGVFQ